MFAVSGPLKDSIFVLPPGEVAVGRDPSNLLSISDPALSRRHCVLNRDPDGYMVRDLESRNGTLVNGVVVKETRLQHGDQLSVGDSVFVLLLREDSEPATDTGVEFDDGMAQATAQFRPQDGLYLQPDRLLREIPVSSQIARNLNALLKISQVVHAIRDLEELQAKILSLIFEVAPADRGAILLDGKGEKFTTIFARHRVASITQPVRVSRTITRRVIDEGLAILGTDVRGSSELGNVKSLLASDVRSLICVPMSVFQKVTGCIYLDTTNPSERFDNDHLELVAAVAGISAVALENARRLQALEQENLRLTAEINLDHNMVGDSAKMKEVYQFLSRVAPTDSTVLIQGTAAPAKNWRRAPSTATARGRASRSWRSIARPFRKVCWRVSCLATSGARSPGQLPRKRDGWKWRMAGWCSWMRSGTCQRHCR